MSFTTINSPYCISFIIYIQFQFPNPCIQNSLDTINVFINDKNHVDIYH